MNRSFRVAALAALGLTGLLTLHAPAVQPKAAPQKVQQGGGSQQQTSTDPEGRDSILDWNAVALEAGVVDVSGTFGKPEQPGPTRASRALAIVHVAMFDAANSVMPRYQPYLSRQPGRGASLDAAVATAAFETLSELYPAQAKVFQAAYDTYLEAITDEDAKTKGVSLGQKIAERILKVRKKDGSDSKVTYTPTGEPGKHDVDPLHPDQGFLDPGWGRVKPFTLHTKGCDFEPLPPPELTSDEYAEAFNEVKRLGGDGATTQTERTDEQTEIGIYWAYDGTKGLGTPPRLYNQIARTISAQQGSTEIENARLFALLNIAMADAGIICWKYKYQFAFWRPILGIRRADEDDNDQTEADTAWTSLGAPASNMSGSNFTPPFPSYTSGHATFGAAVFRILEKFYGTNDVEFTFVSDELNGITTDAQGNTRPLSPRSFKGFRQAARENARSRIYLGIHWQFDADEGIRSGKALADHVFRTTLRPLGGMGREQPRGGGKKSDDSCEK